MTIDQEHHEPIKQQPYQMRTASSMAEEGAAREMDCRAAAGIDRGSNTYIETRTNSACSTRSLGRVH